MECSEERVQLYHDGELEPADIPVFEAHLDGCAGCRDRIDALRDLSARLVDWEVPEPEPGSMARWRALVPDPAPGRVPSGRAGPLGALRRLWTLRVSVPAPVLVAMVLALVLAPGWRGGHPGAPGPVAGDRIGAPDPGVVLPADGSVPVQLALTYREEPGEDLWPDLDRIARDPVRRAYVADLLADAPAGSQLRGGIGRAANTGRAPDGAVAAPIPGGRESRGPGGPPAGRGNDRPGHPDRSDTLPASVLELSEIVEELQFFELRGEGLAGPDASPPVVPAATEE